MTERSRSFQRPAAALAALVVSFVAGAAACGGSSSSGDAGTDAGNVLLQNNSVAVACTSCLSGSTGNDCASQAKSCGNDPACVSLNNCVKACTNLNQGCIQNCEAAASADSISEWTNWFNCGCNDCASQCPLCSN
jgi:hypothetical protein